MPTLKITPLPLFCHPYLSNLSQPCAISGLMRLLEMSGEVISSTGYFQVFILTVLGDAVVTFEGGC